jgi:hypothetical protein
MRKNNALFIAGAFMLAFQACDTAKQTGSETAGQAQTTAETVVTTPATNNMEKGGIKLTSFNDSPKMAEAGMRLVEPVGSSLPAGPVDFRWELTNFALTKMTGHDHSKEMANSMQGQHIHFIDNNQPYVALYEPKTTQNLTEGYHVILSFLSRSYHESLKHATAHDLRVVTVGKPKETNTFDVKGQHMFYSRPKGEYTGNDTKKVMLDFYLVNTMLSPEGNKVRATINGNEFMLDRWTPYTMEGLPMGENKIKLELVDNAGTVIPGAFNTVERTITLKEA